MAAGTLLDLPGIGKSTGAVITEALAGEVPRRVAELEATTEVPLSTAGRPYREALRGDCHCHSLWSDGGATVEAMARTAMSLGHEYMVMTDHSPRLTVAHGLSPDRLREQLVEIRWINERLAPFRILTGIEVDILEDGSLDQEPDLLAELDVVVASAHSKLRMDRDAMTRRMVLAVASPHVDILGHCTGRKLRSTVAQADSDPELVRPESTFDPELVFAACARFDTAVEINCRPERQDPPDRLLDLALEWGCKVSIDTDAHAPGQLEWQRLGCDQGRRPRDRDRPDREHLDRRRPRRVGRLPRDRLADRRARPVAWLPYVEEDRQAQDQRPPQEGQPRAQAQRRAGLTAPGRRDDHADRSPAAAHPRRRHRRGDPRDHRRRSLPVARGRRPTRDAGLGRQPERPHAPRPRCPRRPRRAPRPPERPAARRLVGGVRRGRSAGVLARAVGPPRSGSARRALRHPARPGPHHRRPGDGRRRSDLGHRLVPPLPRRLARGLRAVHPRRRAFDAAHRRGRHRARA